MRFRLLVLFGGAAALSGCATMINPGKTRSVAPAGGGSRITVARLRLKHLGPDLAVYSGTTRLAIRDEASHDLHVQVCRTYHENGSEPEGMVTVNADCMTWILFPYVEVPKSGPHTLRLVRPGQEATVTVKTGTHWQWIWLNAVCLPLTPVCWGVDIATGSWSYYGTLDVDHAIRSAGGNTVAGSRE